MPNTLGSARATSEAMIVAVPKETVSGERRVAMVPELVPRLLKAGLQVHIQTGAGLQAGFTDELYVKEGAQLKPQVLAEADVVLKVRPPLADDIAQLKTGATLIGLLEPDTHQADIELLTARKIKAFAMELIPRMAIEGGIPGRFISVCNVLSNSDGQNSVSRVLPVGAIYESSKPVRFTIRFSVRVREASRLKFCFAKTVNVCRAPSRPSRRIPSTPRTPSRTSS